jgi:tRNA A-37 threonylcarbamoyl transferase component Bud32
MYPQIFGKYVLERELAVGGMARVALATLRGAGGFEKKLVVKQIRDELSVDEEFVRRFVEEAKTTVALSHPNIVPVYELGVEQGTYFLAMEYVDGVSVDALLKTEAGERRGLSPEEGAYLGVEVCRALDYAHRRMQVVHRDITPRNVMVDEEGQVKLIDFGIAARASVAGHDVFGTPGHMPPEQLNRKELLPSTDIFALAVLLMEVWSGSPPFRRKTPTESLAKMHEPHPRLSDTDPRLIPLDDVLASAMSLDPLARPQQADDLGRALRRFLQDVDLGDVARKLGARVVDARAALAKRVARKQAQGSLMKPSRPTMDMRAKTFAAREEMGKWAHGDSEPVEESAPDVRPVGLVGDTPNSPAPSMSGAEGTRRLPASDPPPPEAPSEAGPRSGGAPAYPSSRIETVATRPIETPVAKLSADVPAPPGKGRLYIVTGGAAVLVATALLVARAREATDGSGPKLPASSEATSVTTATSSATARLSGDPPKPALTASSTNAPPGTTSATQRIPSATTTSPLAEGSSARASSAQLVLVGDPGTQVSIDAAPYRPCPAVVSVNPGSHKVRFLFEPTHEERGQPINLAPGARVTVRADFAAATPTIRVER